MTSEGTVKSFNGGKGYGFIDVEGTDIFCHASDCGGAQPAVGDVVTFDLVESPSKPGTFVAKSVTGCSGVLESQKGFGKGAPMAPVEGTGAYQGAVKSFSELKAWGFILHEGEGDIFFHLKDIVDGSVPDRGDVLTYDIEDNPGKPGTLKATNVTGGSKGKGQGKGFGKGKDAFIGKGGFGGFGGYDAAPAWGAPQAWPLAPQAQAWGAPKGKGKFQAQAVQGTGQFQGSVKSFSELKAWGFIMHEGEDVFFHLKDIMDGSVPDRGDILTYDLEENPGKPGTLKATNVTGGSKGKGQGKGFGKGKDCFGGKGGYEGGYDPYGGYEGGYGAAPVITYVTKGGQIAQGPYGGGGKGGKAWAPALGPKAKGKGMFAKGGW